MTIQKLDVFFRTQLTLDQPEVFNSITNLALAPLQHVIGQNRYQSLNGKVSYVPPTTQDPSSFCTTLRKVALVICAFFLAIVLTPIGAITRCMSLRSPQIDRAYSHAYLSQIPAAVQGAFLSLDANTAFANDYLQQVTDSQYLQLMPYLSSALIENYQAQQTEKQKKLSLDKYLTRAIHSLETLHSKLEKVKNPQDLSILQLRRDVFYPFPFSFAQQLESHGKSSARADKDLWAGLMNLRKACLVFLSPESDDMLLKTTKDLAHVELSRAFKSNTQFFNELKEKLESKMEKSKIQEWINGKNSYPFYTQPRVLKLLGLTVAADKLHPFSTTISTCASLLQECGLEEYLSEAPDPQNATVNALMQAMDQLENIAALEELIKTQTA